MHATKLTQIIEEGQTVNDQKLSELERKFEVIMIIIFNIFFFLEMCFF